MTEPELSCGGIVLGEHGTIVLVRHKNNTYWLFPKGRKDGEETDEETAMREIGEETGLVDLEYIDDLGTYERFALLSDNTDDTTRPKVIHMFLFASRTKILAPTLEIEEAKWVPLPHVAEQIGSTADRAWFASVFPRVRQAVQRD